MIEIVRYSPEKSTAWDAFVAQSKNGTFLFNRNYMDYHNDRFHDHSLLFYKDGQLVAVLPANQEGRTFCSHQGLTYGGLLMSDSCRTAVVCDLFRRLNDYLHAEGFQHVVYSPVPHIFHRLPSEEDLYALLNVCGARLAARKVSSVIDLSQRLKWNRDRRYGVNKAFANGVSVQRSNDWPAFWEVLNTNLKEKYGAHPVHTLQEMELLASRFPEHIHLYTAEKDNRVVGGTVVYITPMVAHTQYISANQEGKQLRVMDAVFDELLNRLLWTARYFDFGTSNEDGGRTLVEPLIYQKEGFGARAVCYDTYEWTL